ncbi:MAG: RDD family protein, partial [Gemmatimonadota bacterium]
MTNAPYPSAIPGTGTILDTVEIETPEHVVFSYEIAGLGSRFVALFIDTTLYVLGLLGLAYPISLLPDPVPAGAEEIAPQWAAFVGILILFVLYWGYFLAFEAAWDGQTPGKRWLGIRAVADGGFPITPSAAVVRNLLRLVDLQPVGFYFVGAVTMLMNREAKRLGDLVAGTVVIRDRPSGESLSAALEVETAGPEEVVGAPQLADREFVLLDRFLARREHLAAEARGRLESELALTLG